MYTRPNPSDAEPLTFGVSGKLWRDSLVMYDRQTRTLWSQISGKPMAGPTDDLVLQAQPSTVTTWSAWVKRHPNTRVLVKPKLKRSAYTPYHQNPHRMGIAVAPDGDERLPAKTLVYGIKLGDEAMALPFERLTATTAHQVALGGNPLLIIRPGETQEALAFQREVDGRVLQFSIEIDTEGQQKLTDLQTKSIWDSEQGICIAGPLNGQKLKAVPGTPIFWSIWSRYFPHTAIYPKSAKLPDVP